MVEATDRPRRMTEEAVSEEWKRGYLAACAEGELPAASSEVEALLRDAAAANAQLQDHREKHSFTSEWRREFDRRVEYAASFAPRLASALRETERLRVAEVAQRDEQWQRRRDAERERDEQRVRAERAELAAATANETCDRAIAERIELERKLAALEAPIAADAIVEESIAAFSVGSRTEPEWSRRGGVRAVISLAWQRFAAAMHGEESFVAFADAVGPNDLTAREDFARRMRAALTRALASLGAPADEGSPDAETSLTRVSVAQVDDLLRELQQERSNEGHSLPLVDLLDRSANALRDMKYRLRGADHNARCAQEGERRLAQAIREACKGLDIDGDQPQIARVRLLRQRLDEAVARADAARATNLEVDDALRLPERIGTADNWDESAYVGDVRALANVVAELVRRERARAGDAVRDALAHRGAP